jgi:hypothetical protein
MPQLSSRAKKYFNRAQLDAMAISAKHERCIGSRGIGKSEGFDARRMLDNIFSMPRSVGGLLSPTYAKLLQNTLPAVAAALDRWGFKRDVHYVIGRKPTKNLNFRTPYTNPFSYDHVMAWFNGSIINLISFDRSMSANSMSLDYLMGFEGKYLDYQKIVNEANQANRGKRPQFENCHLHHGTYYSSDMPTSKLGMWLLDDEKKMDVELIDLIKSLFAELAYYKNKSSNTEYTKRKIASIRNDLSLFRSKAFYFGEYNILDNIELVGTDWIAQQQRDLPPLIFQTSILNKRIFKKANGFYSALDDSLHFYTADNSSYFEKLDYNLQAAAKQSCLADSDLLDDTPLCLAFDYNAAISSLCIGQVNGKVLRTTKSMFVKTPKKLTELVEDFCAYYRVRMNRDIIFYFDSTAIHESAISSESFKDLIIRVLLQHDWNVTAVYIGNPMRHDEKHALIDLGMKGDPRYLFPKFNLFNNEYLKLALEQAGVKQGRNGFEKDKTLEKLEDSVDFPDEQKTHITDAWDTLYIGCTMYPQDLLTHTAPANWNSNR